MVMIDMWVNLAGRVSNHSLVYLPWPCVWGWGEAHRSQSTDTEELIECRVCGRYYAAMVNYLLQRMALPWS